jgi:hypothetical protein
VLGLGFIPQNLWRDGVRLSTLIFNPLLSWVNQGLCSMNPSLREQLAAAFPALTAAERGIDEAIERVFGAAGVGHPPHNYLRVADTYVKFKKEFLPVCPLVDPKGRRISVRLHTFPKLLNLDVKPGFSPKKPHTIVEHLEAGIFKEEEYELEQDRLQALFWVPDVVGDPDALFPKKKGHGKIPADHFYIKVYKTDGSPAKLVFTQVVGKQKKSTIVVTSFLTSLSTARGYVGGAPLYVRK